MDERGQRAERGGGSPRISGEIARRLAWAPIRVLAVITGLALVRCLLSLAGRYLLALRREADAFVEDGSIVLDARWSIAGKGFRRSRTVAPLSDLRAARFENRMRYVQLVVGFGCLAVGTWLGIQWLVEGLGAGYPYLALLGAGVVAAGVALDLAMYLLIPAGKGRGRVVLAMGPWTIRLRGVDDADGERFLDAVRRGWRGPPARAG